MFKKIASLGLTILAGWLLISSGGYAAERVRVASPIKVFAAYYLPIYAAEEKGLWRETNLEVEWVPFKATATMHRAIAGGSITIALDNAFPLIPSIARGLPGVIIYNVADSPLASLWVLTESPVKEPKELKGARVGVVSLGGAAHAWARLIFKSYGLEKDIRFVAAGGIPENMAALKSRAVGAAVMSPSMMVTLKVKGEVRELANVADHFPGKPLSTVLFVRKELPANNPDLVKRVVKGLALSLDFLRKNKSWAVEKIKAEQGLPPAAAELLFDSLKFTEEGTIERERVQRVLNFLLDYELITKDKAPTVDKLFSNEFAIKG